MTYDLSGLAVDLRRRYREKPDDMPLARLIARIEANLEEAQVLAADAKAYLKHGHIR